MPPLLADHLDDSRYRQYQRESVHRRLSAKPFSYESD
jgi:hypothetical protein